MRNAIQCNSTLSFFEKIESKIPIRSKAIESPSQLIRENKSSKQPLLYFSGDTRYLTLFDSISMEEGGS